jgi:hypothetical protein
MKQSTILILFFFFGIYTNIAAQSDPDFLMPLWFEDAVGNKDTVFVGYDSMAMSKQLNTQWGEKLITTPFDSIFEVRVAHFDDENWKMTKILIGDFEHSFGIECGVSESMRIMINAKYLPIKVSWDKKLLNKEECHNNTILFPDERVFFLQEWWQARVYYCMSNGSQIIDDFSYETTPKNKWLRHDFEVEGQGIKSLRGYHLMFRDDVICQTLDTEEKEAIGLDLLVYPNPVSDILTIQLANSIEPQQLNILDITGRTVYRAEVSNMENYQIPISDWKNGLYMILLENKYKQIKKVQKFVKL